jgi:hypothetical protein
VFIFFSSASILNIRFSSYSDRILPTTAMNQIDAVDAVDVVCAVDAAVKWPR